MTRSGLLFFVMLCVLLVGCTDRPMPPRCALLGNLTFFDGVNESARHEQPLLASQLVAFVGEPDLTVTWGQVQQILTNHPGFNQDAVDRAMKDMRNTYAFNKGLLDSSTPSSLPMDQVKVWLYRWNDPSQLMVCGLLFDTPAGKMSTAVLVENGRVVGTTRILFN